jgi:carboxyl-terminal processing protease
MALYFLPGGKSTQKVGVEANVQLPVFFILEDVGETALDYPLPAQAIMPFLGVTGNAVLLWKPMEQSMLAKLAARSRKRVAKDAKFAEIIKNNKEAAGKKGIIRLADLRKEMETPAELKQKAIDEDAPFVNESVNVLLDMVTLWSALPVPPALHAEAGMPGR